MTGTIFNIQRFSVNDGPGIRTTVFLKGCPLSCVWCHNPESQSGQPELMLLENRCIRCGACTAHCPQHAIELTDRVVTDRTLCRCCGACLEFCPAAARDIVGRSITVEAVLQEIERDRPFYQQSGGGVTLSGGEPLVQAEFAIRLLQECQERGIHTTLDTCGYAEWKIIDKIRPFVDLFLYDVKIMDDIRHINAVGASNRLILQNLTRLAHLQQNIIVRVPIIPGYTDDCENLASICSFIRGLPYAVSMDILPYHPIAAEKYHRLGRKYTLRDSLTVDDEKMMHIKSFIEQYEIMVNIGG
ncbi:glycyl-radical enzyme activating protein [candidate division KSB1 bacterium]|nr:glycyl-radical enzyme activating protein [candidate division KSB1 bacterium]